MDKIKQHVWTAAKWAAVAAGVVAADDWWSHQAPLVQGFVAIAALIAWSLYLLEKKIDSATRATPPRYACTFSKEIYAHDNDVLPVVWLRQKPRFIMLPFPPYPGLGVRDTIEMDGEYIDFASGTIRTVGWVNGSNGYFRCEVEPDKLWSENVLGAVIGMYDSYGWSTDGDPKAEAALAEWKARQATRDAA